MQELSIIELVDQLIHDAVAHGASDIHLEATAHGLRVRWRIDGVLFDNQQIGNIIMAQVLSRIKVLAHIDIAQKRVPHDGKFKIMNRGSEVDLRVSTFPSIYGEKIVIRILDRGHHMITLNKLGLSAAMLGSFNNLLTRSHGFFLVSGPTGSGKTTTLYAALSALHSPEKNIITLEDPVEYSIDGITQAQVHPEAGFTFEKGIRALLRQDPDVVMIGEIRDRQTAQVAIEAALTGHVVLSTIHTNDAPTVIMRLIDMGIEPFLVNAAISGVMAQRLARMICPSCRVEIDPTDQDCALLKRLGSEPIKLFKGVGCADCMNLGYKGRTGVFELLTMTPALRALVMIRPAVDVIYRQALEDGMQSLRVDGLQKVKDGIISLPELVRTIV